MVSLGMRRTSRSKNLAAPCSTSARIRSARAHGWSSSMTTRTCAGLPDGYLPAQALKAQAGIGYSPGDVERDDTG